MNFKFLLYLFLSLLTLFSVYAEERVVPFYPFTEEAKDFRWLCNYYLVPDADCAIVIEPQEQGQTGISFCAGRESVVYIHYPEPFLDWIATKTPNEALKQTTTIHLDSLSFKSICCYLDSLVNTNHYNTTPPITSELPNSEGTNRYIMSHGKWAHLYTVPSSSEESVISVLTNIQTALTNADTSDLTPDRLGIAECDSFQGNSQYYNWYQEIVGYAAGPTKFLEDIKANLKYPSVSNCISGKIALNVLVKSDGSIDPDSINIIRGLEPEYDKAAIEAVTHLGKFCPNQFYGYPIDSWITIPVRFR